ncbi:Dolichyldiphosphatase 1, partial [Ophiophagus hannah]
MWFSFHSFDALHVVLRQSSCGDFTGHLLAYLSLSPIFIIVGFLTLIVFKRELHTISFLGGLCFNEGVNWLIKNIVQEQRPCPGCTKPTMPGSWTCCGDTCCPVYLLYHTWSQVVYGGFVGSFMAALWFLFTQEILTPLFPRIAAWPLSEFFLIRDTSLIPNILWFEYAVSRAEARNRQRKLGTKLQ